MDIKLNIQQIATQKGITTAYQLQKALNAYPSEAAKLWKGEVKQLSLAMMTRLCNALECNPCDLLIRIEADEASGAAEVSPAATSEPTTKKPAKLSAAQKKAIRNEQQQRWLGAQPTKKATKKAKS